MPVVIVDVVLKPEILDPQGQAIVGALGRLGVTGVTGVRQGKHFELEVEDTVDDDAIARLSRDAAGQPGDRGLHHPPLSHRLRPAQTHERRGKARPLPRRFVPEPPAVTELSRANTTARGTRIVGRHGGDGEHRGAPVI